MSTPNGSAPLARPLAHAPHPLRAALADCLHRHLAVHGSDSLEALYDDLRCRDADSMWTRARVDRAIDDLVRAGHAEISGRRGYVDVVGLIPDDMWQELEAERVAFACMATRRQAA
jgi:hypothetical protein